MAYGVEVYANDGGLAVSSNYPCLYPSTTAIVRSITGNPQTGSWWQTRNGVPILTAVTNVAITSARPPALFFQMDVGDTLGLRGITRQINNQGTWWAFLVVGPALNSSFDIGKLRLYDELPSTITPSTTGYGLTVTNPSNGSVMFDTTRNPLWVSQETIINTGTVLSKGSTAPFYSGFNIAFDQTYARPLFLATSGGLFGSNNTTRFEMVPQRTATGMTLVPRGPGPGTFSSNITIQQFRLQIADAPGT